VRSRRLSFLLVGRDPEECPVEEIPAEGLGVGAMRECPLLPLLPVSTSTTSMFTRAGFTVVARGATQRPIIRYDLKSVLR
jgi:hypothetical protein